MKKQMQKVLAITAALRMEKMEQDFHLAVSRMVTRFHLYSVEMVKNQKYSMLLRQKMVSSTDILMEQRTGHLYLSL